MLRPKNSCGFRVQYPERSRGSKAGAAALEPTAAVREFWAKAAGDQTWATSTSVTSVNVLITRSW